MGSYYPSIDYSLSRPVVGGVLAAAAASKFYGIGGATYYTFWALLVLLDTA